MSSTLVQRRQLRALLALAIMLKVAYFFGYGVLPFLERPLFDSFVYLHQAEAIRAGRFDDPSLVAFGPLYGWFLALFGGAAVHVQFALGLVNLVVLHRMVARRFDEAAGLVSAALYLGYGLLLFYESKILSETLGLTLALLSLALYVSPRFVAGRWRTAVGAGVLFGLAILARPNLLITAPFLVLAAALPWSRPSAGRAALLRRAAGLLAGMAVVTGVNGAWNLAHTGRFIPVILRSNTAAVATATAWDGTLTAFGPDGRVSPWDVVEQARRALERDEPAAEGPGLDLAGWIAGAPAKLRRTFSNIETTFQYGYYGERTEVRALAVLPVGFGALLLLGAVGAVFVWRRDGPRALLPWLPHVLGVVVTTTLFHPSSRYRVAMVLPLLALAGPGVMGLVRLADRRWRLVLGGAVAAACAAFAWGTYGYELRSPAMWELRVAEAEVLRGDRAAAAARIERARRLGAGDPEVDARLRYIRGLLGGTPRASDGP